MRSLARWPLLLSLMALLLVGCGKNNESGKNSSTNQWPLDPYGAPVPVNSPYNYGGVGVNQIVAENPCMNGQTQRWTVQKPLTGFEHTVHPQDVYADVSSFGDVAVVVGSGSGQPPMFIGYICPRSFSNQGTLTGLQLGTTSRCRFRPITGARIQLMPQGTIDFRMLDLGSSRGTPFSFCM